MSQGSLPERLEQTQKALFVLYRSADSTQRKEAERWLTQMHTSPDAWQLAAHLMNLPDAEAQFFGAKVFRTKLSKEWATLTPEFRQELRSLVSGWLLSLAETRPPLVFTQVCVAMSCLGIRSMTSGWPSFIPDMVSLLSSSNHLLALLELLRVFAEEVDSVDPSSSDRVQLLSAIRPSLPQVLQLIETALQSADRKVAQRGLELLAAWLPLGQTASLVAPLLPLVIMRMRDPGLIELAVEVLISAMEQMSTLRMDSHVDLLANLLGSLSNDVTSVCAEGNADAAEPLVDLMAMFIEHMGSKIVLRIDDPAVTQVLNLLLMLTACPYEEQTIPQKAIGAWSTLHDEFEHSDMPEARRAELSPHMAALFKVLVPALVNLARYPAEARWSSMSAESQAQFHQFRRELNDVVLVAYYVLRDEMVAYVCGQCLPLLASAGSANWEPLEAALFCLKSISEGITAGSDGSAPAQLSPMIEQVITAIVQLPPAHPTVQLACLQVTAAYSEPLAQRGGPVLGQLFAYVLGALSAALSQSAVLQIAASQALLSMCTHCRPLLSSQEEAMDTVLEAYMVISEGGLLPVRSNMSHVVAAFASAFPPEDAGAFVFSAFEVHFSVVGELMDLAPSVELEARASHELRCMRWLFKHVALEAPGLDLKPVARSIFSAICGIAEKWTKHAPVMHEACLLLRWMFAGVRSNQKDLFDIVAPLLAKYFAESRSVSALDALSGLVNDAPRSPEMVEPQANVYGQVTAAVCQATAAALEPETLARYLELSEKVAKTVPEAFFRAMPHSLQVAMDGLCRLEKEVVRASANLFVVLLQQAKEGNAQAQVAVVLCTPTVVQNIFMCIGGRAPRSLDALLGGLLQKLIAAVPDAARVAMFNLLGQEGFPSVNISAQDKVAFINKAMRTRNKSEFQNLINNFSKQCRLY